MCKYTGECLDKSIQYVCLVDSVKDLAEVDSEDIVWKITAIRLSVDYSSK